MYPHFKLLVDKLKSQDEEQQVDLSEIPILEDQEGHTYSQQEYDREQEEVITGDQRVENAMASENPHTSDIIIRAMMENATPESIDIPQDLRNIKKPKSFNKRKDKKDKGKFAPEYQAPILI